MTLKRLFDFLLALFLGVTLLPIVALIFLVIILFDGFPALYWSSRVGKNNVLFRMPKFRTMRKDTPQLATHLLDGKSYLIKGGGLMRKLSLDEIPQLWSILKGDMSFVGPRPALCNQDDLIALRTEYGVHRIAPGLTGWAQINGRDYLTISMKVKFDAEYLAKRSFFFDLKIIILTFERVVLSKGVSH